PPSGRGLEVDALDCRDDIGQEGAEQLIADRPVELRASEQVECEGLRREQVAPQALLVDKGAVFTVRRFPPCQLGELGGQEVDAGPCDLRCEAATEGASPSFLWFDLAHWET